MKSKREAQQTWLLGAYFKSALQSSVLVCGLATRDVVNKLPKFPKMPYEEETKQEELKDESLLKAERQKAYNHFLILLSSFNKK